MIEKEVCIITNDKLNKKKLFSDNKNTNNIIHSFKRFKKIYLIGNIFKITKVYSKYKNFTLINNPFLISRMKNKNKISFFFISITPRNFFILLLILLFGIKKKKIFLYLISDGFKEYKIKFSILGYLIYFIMFYFFKSKSNIISCSKNISNLQNFKHIPISSLKVDWIKKKLIKKKIDNKNIKILYVGRFRIEKGYRSLISLFEQLDNQFKLTMIGYDQNIKIDEKSNITFKKNINNNKIIKKLIDSNDILILPSYTEAYPQVVLESLSRLKPVIIFKEISFIKKDFKSGLFVCDRNVMSLKKTILKIIHNYNEIQKKIRLNKLILDKDFKKNIENYFIQIK